MADIFLLKRRDVNRPGRLTNEDFELIEVLEKGHTIASQSPPSGSVPLKFYQGNWCDRIAAKALEKDDDGPTNVLCCGHCYTRRTGENPKHGAAIAIVASQAKPQ